DRRRAVRRRGDRSDGCRSLVREDLRRSFPPSLRARGNVVRGYAAQMPMTRQEWGEMRFHRHRSHARPAAAVRYAERLVQVEMRNVRAEMTRRGQADERVQVRAVDVD